MASGAELAILISGRNASGPAFKSAAADAAGLRKAVDGSASGLPKLSGALDLAKGAAVAGGIALAGVGVAMAAVVGPAAEFEAAMSSIGAVSGASTEEMKSLQGLALQLGKDTAFSAKEAAAGIEELVKGGLSIEDVMGGGAKAALDLAAAGTISVADAAEIASNAVGQFGLKGSELGHVADMIAGAANASSIGVNDFKFSLSAAGAVAATVGFSFDDLAVAIAEMGKAGIKGSDAGTSLKTMMLNLQPSTKAQVAEFERLGIVSTDVNQALVMLQAGLADSPEGLKAMNKHMKDGTVSADNYFKELQKLGKIDDAIDFNKWAFDVGLMGNQFFDASGKVKSMAEVQGVLAKATAGMTEQQKLASLEIMFGSDAIRAAAVLSKEGSAGFETMAEAMGKVTAAEVGAKKLDNLKGSLSALSGSLETAAITAGLALTPALKGLVDQVIGLVNAGIPLIEQFGAELPTMMTQAGETFAALRTAIEPVLPVILAVGAALASLSIAGAIAGAISSMIAAFSAVGAAVAASGGILTSIVAILGGPLTLTIAAVIAIVAGLALAWSQNWGDIQGKTQAVWAVVEPIIAAVIAEVGRFATEMAPLAIAAWTNIQTQVEAILTALGAFVNAAMTALAGFWTEHHETIKAVAEVVWTAIQTLVGLQWGILQATIKAGLQLLAGDWGGAWVTMRDVVISVWTTLHEVTVTIWASIRAAVMAAINTLIGWARSAGGSLVSTFAEGIRDRLGDVYDSVRNMVERIRGLMPGSDADEGPLSDLTASGRALPTTFARGIRSAAGAPLEAMLPSLQGVRDGLPALAIPTAVGRPVQGVAPSGGGPTVIVNFAAQPLATRAEIVQYIAGAVREATRGGRL